MRKIIYTDKDGKLCIVTPVRNTHPFVEDLTDEQIEQRALNRISKDLNPVFVDPSIIPADRTNRDSWRFNGSIIVGD